jgi:hypothetical protein
MKRSLQQVDEQGDGSDFLKIQAHSNIFSSIPEDVISIILAQVAHRAYMNVLSCVCKSLYNSITRIVSKLDLRQYLDMTAAKVEASLERYKTLNELHFGNTKLKMSASFTAALFGLNLKSFSAPNSGLTLSFLGKVSGGFPSLEYLNISGNKTNIKTLSSLSNLPRLSYLDVSYSPELKNGQKELSECLRKFNSLKTLSLAGIPLPEFDVTSLSSLHNLHSLNLSDTTVKPFLSSLHLTSLTFLNFAPISRPIEFPDSLKTLDIDIGTFYYVPPANVETLCVRKLNDFVDDLLSMTERSKVRCLELRQFKIMVNVFMSGVSYLLKRMPSVDTLLLDLAWDDGIGKFDDNLHLFFTSIKLFENIKKLNLRIDITTQMKGSISIIWQALVSVIIQQRILAIVSQFDAGVVIIFREGCAKTGKSLICRYLNGKWGTTKRHLRPDEKIPIPGNLDNIRNK